MTTLDGKGATEVKRTILLSALLLAATMARASAPFEGVADFKITSGSAQGKSTPGSGTIFVAPGAYRMEFAMSAGAGAAREPGAPAGKAPRRIAMTMVGRASDSGKIFLIDDEKKTYVVLDTKKATDNAPRDTFVVQKLGRDTVAGLSCQNALLTSSRGTEIEICVASDVAISSDWLAAINRRQADPDSWFAALTAQGIQGFPVRWVIRKKGSTEALASMEITRLEKKTLPASLFEVPAGYTKGGSPMSGLTPEQEKAMADARARMGDALGKMTPEQRKAYEDAVGRNVRLTPTPGPEPKSKPE